MMEVMRGIRRQRSRVGKGQIIVILARPDSPYCPVAAWVKNGALFLQFYRKNKLSEKRLDDRSVADLIKEANYQLKGPSLDYHHFSSLSLRRGFLTRVGTHKAVLLMVIAQSQHTRKDSVMGYVIRRNLRIMQLIGFFDHDCV